MKSTIPATPSQSTAPVRIPMPLRDKLKRESSRSGISMQHIVSEALMAYLPLLRKTGRTAA